MNQRQQWRVAVAPGDGIGPEVMSVTLDLLDALGARTGLQLRREVFPWPSTAWHRDHGSMMPADALATLGDFDAILLGALGDPGPASDAQRPLLPDAVSLAPLLDMRKHFDLWACERPARLLEGAPQYLADARAREVDMLVIRENSEGEYVNQGGRLHRGTDREIATQVELFTRPATERLLRHAFASARRRIGERASDGRTRRFRDAFGRDGAAEVCLVTKRNALPHWGELYCEVCAAIAPEFPEVVTRHELVDAACMKFVQSPWQFDVVVASNLQGDILTDLAAVLSGGMGLAPSANLRPDDRSAPPLFEPTHGSAPDIVGRDLADPRAMMLTAGAMLDWMGAEDPRAREAARRLREAVQASLLDGAGSTTSGIAASVMEHLENTESTEGA